MKYVVSDNLKIEKGEVISCIENFEKEGELFGKGDRNIIKLFPYQGGKLNIKSFKTPNFINRLAYRYFRKSKAERSYWYAHRLLAAGVGTPAPIAYAEEKEGVFFGRSFYVSEQLECDLTYRTLVQEPDFPNGLEILKAFTRFTYKLHENEIEFLDHSPGNTLIRLKGGEYQFFLVDLNRMNFRKMDFEARMRNFSRLTPKKEMVEVMAREYSRLYSRPEEEVLARMWFYTQEFQEKFKRKRELKRKLKFWKK